MASVFNRSRYFRSEYLLAIRGHGWLPRTAAYRRITLAPPDCCHLVGIGRRLWDAKTDAVLATLSGHTVTVLSAAFSPDGTRVVTASPDDTARVWDAVSGAQLGALSGHAARRMSDRLRLY